MNFASQKGWGVGKKVQTAPKPTSHFRFFTPYSWKTRLIVFSSPLTASCSWNHWRTLSVNTLECPVVANTVDGFIVRHVKGMVITGNCVKWLVDFKLCVGGLVRRQGIRALCPWKANMRVLSYGEILVNPSGGQTRRVLNPIFATGYRHYSF